MYLLFLIYEFEPDVIVKFKLAGLIIVFTRVDLNLTNFVMSTFMFTGLVGYGMAIFHAILEYTNVRFACFAHAGDDEIGICDVAKT